MDDAQFTQLKQEILDALDSNEKISTMRQQVNRFISHLESERRVSANQRSDIDELKAALNDTNETDGLRTRITKLIGRVQTIEDYMKDRKTQNNAILGGVALLIVKAVWELISHPAIPK